jgi:hypothetical protein
MFRQLLSIGIALLIFNVVNAQNVNFRAVIDTNNLMIGDQAKIKLIFKSDKKLDVRFPAVPDSIGKIEFLARTIIDTSNLNNAFQLSQSFVITCFDSGVYSLPPFEAAYNNGDSFVSVQSNLIQLKFNTMKVDTASGFKDIKPPAEIPFSIWDYIYYIIIGLVLLLVGGLSYYLYQKYRKPKLLIDGYDPHIDPHIIALEALKQLDNEKLWQKGSVKIYFIRLSDIVRIYIERRFSFIAMEMTTDEIITTLQEIKLSDNLINDMKNTLSIADLAKFAKYSPLPDESSFCMNASLDFVRSTARQSLTAEPESTGGTE